MAIENVSTPETDIVSIGQGEQAPAESGQGTSQVASRQSTPWYTDPDGQSYTTREEFDKVWKQSKMMRADHTKKTQEVSSLRRQHEQERAEFERQRKAFEEERNSFKREYEAYDKKIRQNPQIYQYLKQQLSSGNQGFNQESIDKYIEEKYGSKFKKIDDWEAKQESERQKAEAAEFLKGMYEDFDIKNIDKVYQELLDGDMRTLMEMIYYANKGRSTTPLETERKMTEQIEKKKTGGLPSSHGAKTSTTPVPRNLNDAARIARERYTGE